MNWKRTALMGLGLGGLVVIGAVARDALAELDAQRAQVGNCDRCAALPGEELHGDYCRACVDELGEVDDFEGAARDGTCIACEATAPVVHVHTVLCSRCRTETAAHLLAARALVPAEGEERARVGVGDFLADPAPHLEAADAGQALAVVPQHEAPPPRRVVVLRDVPSAGGPEAPPDVVAKREATRARMQAGLDARARGVKPTGMPRPDPADVQALAVDGAQVVEPVPEGPGELLPNLRKMTAQVVDNLTDRERGVLEKMHGQAPEAPVQGEAPEAPVQGAPEGESGGGQG